MTRAMTALIFTLAVLIASLSAAAITHMDVNAMGAPTENFTIPDPLEDSEHSEIKPPVNAILHGTSALPSGASPDLTASLYAASAGGGTMITGDEQWYLDVDINMPGWLYIYEYLPPADQGQGIWIAYKWQLREQGRWRLGPFRPGEDETEGQHIYRLFFYGNGRWASDSSQEQRSYLVFWNYVKGPQQPPQEPQIPLNPTPEPPASADNSLLKFITNPLFLLIAPSAIVIITLAALYARRRLRSQHDDTRPADQQLLVDLLEQPGTRQKAPTQGTARAILELPNSLKIRLGGEREIIGRAQVARALSLDELGLISKHHFKISFADDKAFIEDLGSTNGTAVNASSIRDAGPVELNDGDVIEMAGQTSLRFRSSI